MVIPYFAWFLFPCQVISILISLMSICNYEKWTGKKLFTVNKDDLVAYPALRFISPSSFRVSSFGFRSNKIELVYLSRLGWLSQCTRNISMTYSSSFKWCWASIMNMIKHTWIVTCSRVMTEGELSGASLFFHGYWFGSHVCCSVFLFSLIYFLFFSQQ